MREYIIRDVVAGSIENKLTIENNDPERPRGLNDFVGLGFMNNYLQFPLIIGETLSDDFKTITFPPTISRILQVGDMITVYLWREMTSYEGIKRDL